MIGQYISIFSDSLAIEHLLQKNIRLNVLFIDIILFIYLNIYKKSNYYYYYYYYYYYHHHHHHHHHQIGRAHV